MTINEIQDEIIEEFNEFDDWMDRYQLLIDLGAEAGALPESEKVETNLIDGCQSRVWIVCDQNADGTLTFRAESDALIVKGIVTLLLRVVTPLKKSVTPTFILCSPSDSVSISLPLVPMVFLP